VTPPAPLETPEEQEPTVFRAAPWYQRTREKVHWEGLTPPYSTIVVDPPWRYRTYGATSTAKLDVKGHYSDLSNAEIAALPVASLATPNAHLYLWVTVPHLFGIRTDRSQPAPVDILEGWGFTWKHFLTWVKTGNMGLGYSFRGETEHVLFGVRGSLPIAPADRVSNVFSAQKRRHSEKPRSFFDIVEKVSPGPYVELFARQPCLGWDSWGFGYEGAA
jgi:N6-adenosine-specific RNA methylase IME4